VEKKDFFCFCFVCLFFFFFGNREEGFDTRMKYERSCWVDLSIKPRTRNQS
jgi:hypothetical protein